MRRPRSEHLPLFDALRGTAAIFVLVYHGLLQINVDASIGRGGGDQWWWRYAHHLDVAVPIFLAISGFLLYRPFARARFSGRPLPSLRDYGIRRALRIVPAYWVALTIIAVWLSLDDVFTASGIASYYGFGQIYRAHTAIGGIGQAWTLCLEVTFYLFLPVWALLMRRGEPSLRRELLGIGALIGLSLLYKAAVLTGPADNPGSLAALPYLFPLPAYIDMIAAGMALAVLSAWAGQRPELPALLERVRRSPGPVWLLAALLWLGACWVAGPSGAPSDPVTPTAYFVRHLFYLGFVFLLLTPAVWGEPNVGLVRRYLAWRPIAYVGTVSFSFYLVHLFVLNRQATLWGDTPSGALEWTAWIGVAFLGSLALGSLGYWLIERPAMQLGQRLGRRSRSAPREPAAAGAP